MASELTPVVNTRPTYSSVFSFVSLLVSCGAGYFVFEFYRDGASDEMKYGSLVSAIAALVLCCALVARSLTKVELTIWGLRSVKVCVGASIFQTIVACMYLYAVFYLPATNFIFQRPIIYTAITCVIAIHGYMLYVNIRQTRLIFLSLTIGVLELIGSIVIVVLGLLYVLLYALSKAESRNNGNSPTQAGRTNIVGGFGTYNAYVTIKGLPRKVRVQADNATIAKEILEGQFGAGSVGTPMKEF